jgi:hypothetical protein
MHDHDSFDEALVVFLIYVKILRKGKRSKKKQRHQRHIHRELRKEKLPF